MFLILQNYFLLELNLCVYLIFLIRKLFLYCFYFFSVFFGWVIFEEIKNHQIYSDLNFDVDEFESVQSETEINFSFSVKTDAMVRLHIPFLFSGDISESDFSENIAVNGKSPLCAKKISRRGEGKAVLALYFAEPVNIESIKLVCKKNISYLRDGEIFQTEQYGLPAKTKILFCFCFIIFILLIFAVFKCLNLYVKSFSLKYFFTVALLGIGCICIWPAF